MVNVIVNAAANIRAGTRVVIRDANDRVYVFVNAGGNIRAYKGNVVGEPASFAEQEPAGAPDNADYVGLAAAIDSVGLVHIAYYFNDSAAHGASPNIRYAQFRTSAHATTQDDWVLIDEEVAVLDNGEGNYAVKERLAITLTNGDDPQVAWCDITTDMGTDKTSFYYATRPLGTWFARVLVRQNSSATFAGVIDLDIFIGPPTDAIGVIRPIIITKDNDGVTGQIDAHHGDQLQATTFTTEADITGTINVAEPSSDDQHVVSMAQDSNGDIIVAFVEDVAPADLMIVKHLASNGWATWETPTDVDIVQSHISPSIAINGTNIYIFDEDNNDDIRLWKDEGSGFSQETADPDLPNVGTFSLPIVKWASRNNNSPRELDYVFQDSGGAVLYNTFQGAALPVAGRRRFPHIPRSLRY